MSKPVASRWPLFVLLAALPGVACGSSALSSNGQNGQKPLQGIWSGQVQVNAPGFAWGPFDTLTLGFATDGALNALQFAAGQTPAHTYGSAPDDFPLEGSRQAPFAAGSTDTVQVTVNTADFASDHLDFSYRIQGIDDGGITDYLEETKGQLQGDVLQVTYSATGTILIAPIAATASGDLHKN